MHKNQPLGRVDELPEPEWKTRRETLKRGAIVAGLLVSTGLFPQSAWAAYNTPAFEARSVEGAVRALGAGLPVESLDVVLGAPEVAEDGASVSLSVSTSLPAVRQLLILVEKNPAALAAVFHLTDRVEANMATRCKMDRSSDVYAVAVMADGRVLFAKKAVTVILGGCGG